MCFSLIWKDLFKSIKIFRLKSQLLLCYIPGIALVMVGLVITIYILLNNLENSTVHEIEETLNTISTHNSKNFVKEYSKTVENQLNNTGIISSYINFFINNLLYSEQIDSPFILPFITPYEDLPRDCTVKMAEYDQQYVCMNYSSVTYGQPKHPVTDKLGYLAYILPDIFTLLTPYIHRIIVFVPEENSTILFPGQRLPQGYSAYDSPWYTDLNDSTDAFIFVPSYTDGLNLNQSVVSVAQKLKFQLENNYTLCLNVEIQEKFLYSLFSTNAYILDNEEKVLVTQTGHILSNPNATLFKNFTKMNEFNSDIWEAALNQDIDENHFILHHDKAFYRVAIHPIPASSNTTWLFMFLFLKENTLMKYKNETQDTLNSFNILLLSLTCVIGLIIIIASAIIVNLTGLSISKPLIGIKTLTDRINVGEVDIEKELEKLEEGTEQVADLVRAFKSLATTISYRRHTEVQVKGKTEVFPPNELYKTQRITWKEFLKQIPE